jgi:MFS family permease
MILHSGSGRGDIVNENARTIETISKGELRKPDALADGRRPLALVLSIFTGNAACAMIFDALPPVMPALSAHFGGGEHGDMIALLAGTLPIFGMALSGLASGGLIERYGIKRVLLVSLLMFAFMGSAGLVVGAAFPLLATRLLVGITTGTMITCGTSLIAASYDGAGRARMTGRTYGVGAVCAIVFVAISGAVATISWRAPFALHAALAAFFLAPILSMKAIAPIAADNEYIARSTIENLRPLRPAVPAYCLIFAVVLIGTLFNVQLPFLLAQIGATAPRTIANVCVGYAAAVALTNVAYGWVHERLGISRTSELALVVSAVAAFLCASAPSTWWVALGAAIGGIGMGLGVPVAINLVMHRVAPMFAPRALSLATTMMFLGGSSAPLIFGPIRVAFGLHGEYYISAAVTVAGLLLYRLRAFKRNVPIDSGAV